MFRYLKRKVSFSSKRVSFSEQKANEPIENAGKLSDAASDKTETESHDPSETDSSIRDDVTESDEAILVPDRDVIDLDADVSSGSEIAAIAVDRMKVSSASQRHLMARDEQSSRPREPQRRRAAAPPFTHFNGRAVDYDDPGTMSDIELSSFQRAGYARASMPIVRSASTSLERPIGLVFLVYRDETKKALLPNEITSLDTVRALFVRAFPEKLTMELLDSPKRKIYILEASTSIFFQLEDLRDIKDRTVLRIHECDSDEPQYVKCQVEIRGRTRQGFVKDNSPHFREEMAKAQSLPVTSAQNYPELLHKERMQWEMEQEYLQQQQRRSRSRSLTPDPPERPRSLSAGPPSRGRYSHSPDRLPTPERGPAHLNPIPENPRLLANGFRQAAVSGGHFDMGGHPQGHPSGHPLPTPPGRVMSPPPMVYDSVGGGYPQTYVSHSTRAPGPQGPMRATGPPPPDMRGNNRGGPPPRQSLPFGAVSNPVYDNFPQRTQPQPYRVMPERDVLSPRQQNPASHDVSRMERMEAQIASLAAWVHQVQRPPMEGPPGRRNSNRSTSSCHSEGTDTYPASTASKQNVDSSFSTKPGLSDIPDAFNKEQAVVTPVMRDKINDVRCRMQELRVELQGLRRMEQLNQEAMRDSFADTLSKIKKVMGAVPGAEDQVVRQQRMEVNTVAEAYRQDKARVEKELSDLEISVEELKQDVIAHKCRVNIADVESLALVLSNITKALADLKARFPKVHESLRKVMAGEMEIVVMEERFLKEEPQHIEAALKRCKKLTSTLCTLKRLASVQDSRPPQVPLLAQERREVGEEDRMAVLDCIRAMVPDHETRVHNMEAADASRERKKKIVTQHESLKFTKSLQTASKSLRPPDQHKDDDNDNDNAKKSDDMSDRRKSEPPIVPAKPARLMLTSDSRHDDVVIPTFSTPLASMSHTVTVTSQVLSPREKSDSDTKGSAHSSARSAFFSSMETATSADNKVCIEASPTIKVSSAAIYASTAQAKPVVSGGVHYTAVSSSARRPSASNGSHQSGGRPEDMEEDSSAADKGRRVPPPPPPRKSSARYPYGIGPLSPGESGGGGPSLRRQNSGERSPDRGRQGGMVYKTSTPSSSSSSSTITPTSRPLSSSTPKPPTPQKPPNLSQQAMKRSQAQTNRQPSLQLQRVGVGPEPTFSTFVPPVPAAVTTNSEDPFDDGDLSGSESTGSTTSLDSQQGATLQRTNSAPPIRPPKPSPPQRCSSLTSKDSRCKDWATRAESHVVEVRKPLVVGNMTVQVNGLDRRENGHKT